MTQPQITVAEDFQPVTLHDQRDAILRELDLAQRRLPLLAQKGPKGQAARMHWCEVQRRIFEFKSMVFTIDVLARAEAEGRLPPELAAELRNARRPS